MNSFDFYDANMTVRLRKKNARIGKKDVTYSLYVYPSRDSSLAYAVAVFESEDFFALRCVENYTDALTLFELISENDVDVSSLNDVIDDYYYAQKVYNM